jgi:hypothetical protein
VVCAPEQLNVTSKRHRDSVLRFIDEVEDALKTHERVHLSFNRVTLAYPCGTLLFRAKLDTWIKKYPNRLYGRYPTDAVVEELFQHIGVLGLLNLKHRKAAITHDQVMHWHFHSGAIMDPAIYKDLTLSLRDRIVHPQRELFADCLNEAVYNTVNHAYDFEVEGLPEPSLRNWWIFSLVKSGMVTVVVLDLGVSIPRSLLQRPEWKDYARLRNRDGQLIEAAACSPRTSTKLAHRGKGLPEMLEFSENLSSGALQILSRKGVFSFDARTQTMIRDKYHRAIPGTIVMWQIPIAGDGNDEPT